VVHRGRCRGSRPDHRRRDDHRDRGPTTSFSAPLGITTGPDGNLWFTDGLGAIDSVTASGTFTEHALMNSSSLPWGITAGPDGNLWFADPGADSVSEMTTAGVVRSTRLPADCSNPLQITAGPDGNLWLTGNAADRIAIVTPTI
jgi:virginiamycin B lyase